MNVGMGLSKKITGKTKLRVGFLYPNDTIEALFLYSMLKIKFPNESKDFSTSNFGFTYFSPVTCVTPALALTD